VNIKKQYAGHSLKTLFKIQAIANSEYSYVPANNCKQIQEAWKHIFNINCGTL